MALAPYFDKSALSAAHLLKGFEYDAFRKTLDAQQIGLAFDDAAAASQEGQWTLELTSNLLARLYPTLAIVPLQADPTGLAAQLQERAAAINPNIAFGSDLAATSVCVVVGEQSLEQPKRVIYAGSDGWIVRLSTETPVGSGNTHNPFGAGASACFVAANVFRAVFNGQLDKGKLDLGFTLSLLDYRLGDAITHNPDLPATDLGETFLVGLGAIGNGAIWALARHPNLTGDLHLIDHELLDDTNPQRYVLTSQTDAIKTVLKVDVALRELAGTGLTPHRHPKRWGDYLRARGNWKLERVAVAVDTPEDRVAVQASLPKWLVNAWTQPDNLGVSRHAFHNEHACLACLYWPDGQVKNYSELVAEAIGMPDNDVLRKLLYTGEPVPRDYLLQIAANNKLTEEAILPFEGVSLREFYSRAVCGGALLPFGSQAGKGTQAEVPMAFQSALAGIMLAAEMVGHVTGLKEGLPTKTTINLLRPLGSHLSTAEQKQARCFCQDQVYIDAYRTK